jgi:hypothetical protein
MSAHFFDNHRGSRLVRVEAFHLLEFVERFGPKISVVDNTVRNAGAYFEVDGRSRGMCPATREILNRETWTFARSLAGCVNALGQHSSLRSFPKFGQPDAG